MAAAAAVASPSSAAVGADFSVDSDWVFADDFADEFAGDSDWVIADGDEGSVACLFLSGGGGASFSGRCRGVRLSFLPFRASAVASSGGRLLLRGPWSQFYTSDPTTSKYAPLPLPPRPHSISAAPADFAIVSVPPAAFRVVVAFHDCFEIFNSETARWQTIPLEGLPSLIADSAVGACRSAFWKTADNTVLALNPENGEFRVLPSPPQVTAECYWQLGEAKGKLCCAVAGDGWLCVYSLVENDIWELAARIPYEVSNGVSESAQGRYDLGGKIVCTIAPRPLRFESENLEVVLRIGPKKIVAVDLDNAWVRVAKFEGSGMLTDRDGDYVAHVLPATL